MKSSELTAEELMSPSSRVLASLMAFFELVTDVAGKEINSRMLRIGYNSVIMGRNKGKQAPTIPSEDSTIGQYTVGVNRSSHQS